VSNFFPGDLGDAVGEIDLGYGEENITILMAQVFGRRLPWFKGTSPGMSRIVVVT